MPLGLASTEGLGRAVRMLTPELEHKTFGCLPPLRQRHCDPAKVDGVQQPASGVESGHDLAFEPVWIEAGPLSGYRDQIAPAHGIDLIDKDRFELLYCERIRPCSQNC